MDQKQRDARKVQFSQDNMQIDDEEKRDVRAVTGGRRRDDRRAVHDGGKNEY